MDTNKNKKPKSSEIDNGFPKLSSPPGSTVSSVPSVAFCITVPEFDEKGTDPPPKPPPIEPEEDEVDEPLEPAANIPPPDKPPDEDPAPDLDVLRAIPLPEEAYDAEELTVEPILEPTPETLPLRNDSDTYA